MLVCCVLYAVVLCCVVLCCVMCFLCCAIFCVWCAVVVVVGQTDFSARSITPKTGPQHAPRTMHHAPPRTTHRRHHHTTTLPHITHPHHDAPRTTHPRTTRITPPRTFHAPRTVLDPKLIVIDLRLKKKKKKSSRFFFFRLTQDWLTVLDSKLTWDWLWLTRDWVFWLEIDCD
jgi:hypothetical protein